MVSVFILSISTGILILILIERKFKKIRNALEYEHRVKQKKLEDEIEILRNIKEDLSGKFADAEFLATVTRQTENAVMLMDADGYIKWINPSFTRMYEYSYQEFIDALGDNIRKTSFNPQIIDRLNRCIQTKKSVTYEALNITKTGKSLWTQTSLVPLLNDSNQVIGLVTIDSDIHKRITASDALVEHTISFQNKIEKISDQLNTMIELTDILFDRIEKSQRRIDRTDQIISHVKTISDQTKLLGINASIEAHSAGDYGKGFRVIANEMVTISNKTIESLKEINDLIGSVKRSSDKLGNEKERSEEAISLHRAYVEELKKEISEVEEVLHTIKYI